MSYSRMETNKNISDKDWELIAKSIYDEHSAEASEGREVSDETQIDRATLEEAKQTAQQVDWYLGTKSYDADRAWEKVEKRIRRENFVRLPWQKSILLNPFVRIAAMVVLAFLLAFSGYEIFRTNAPIAMVEVLSGNNPNRQIELPDGTLVSLNLETRFSYPEKFDGKTREVNIEGEAFFEVKPDKSKPFIIHAGNAQIKVLGTSFNVNAYPETKQVEVIVETGRVQFSNHADDKHENDELILTPGDKGTLDCNKQLMSKTTNRDPNFIAWKTRIFTFKATPLSEVVDELAKVYKADIKLASPELGGLLLTSQCNNYSLDFIIEIIKTTFDLDVEQVGEGYILKAKS